MEQKPIEPAIRITNADELSKVNGWNIKDARLLRVMPAIVRFHLENSLGEEVQLIFEARSTIGKTAGSIITIDEGLIIATKAVEPKESL